ncbi:MAG: gfo/Idh/MocA family oxidoreductase, partial [Hungatella sp.]
NLYYLIDGVARIQDPALAGGSLLDVGVYALTFASLVMGDQIGDIHATAIKTAGGVDAQTAVVLAYPGGQMAVLCSGIMSLSDRKGIIYGSKGYIIVENINNFESIQVYNIKRELVADYPCPPQISGYEYQIEACVAAIRAGEVECPQMPHSKALEILHQMDEIRRQIGIVYPCESLGNL